MVINRDQPDLVGIRWHGLPGPCPALAVVLDQLGDAASCVVKQNQRRTVYRVQTTGTACYLKHTWADGVLNWTRGMLRCHGQREFAAGQALAERGVPVVPHLAWGRRGAESAVLTQAVEPALTLDAYWPLVCADPGLRAAALAAIASLLAAMGRAGVRHPDFHPSNVLVTVSADTGPAAVLVDVQGVQVGCRGPAAALSRLRLVALLRSQLRLRETRLLADAALAGADPNTVDEMIHAAHLAAAQAFRHRWPGIRRRHAETSSVCELGETAAGRWLLCRPFTVTEAEEALAAHLANMRQGTNVLKRDVKRCLSRVSLHSREVIVKEFLHPGPFGPFRADSRSWFAAHRVHSSLVPVANCLAWLRHADGRGFHILDDVGEKTLTDEMREGNDWHRRRRLIEAAGQVVGLLHAANVDHGDLKPANFVSSENPPILRLVDFDGMRFPHLPLSRRRRAKGMEQLFEELHCEVTKREACRFLVSYAIHAGVRTRTACELMPRYTDWLPHTR